MSQRGPTWGALKPIMDKKIIEKPMFFLGFFDTSKKSLEALGDALGDLLESLGGALGTPWEPLGMPWRPYVDAGEGQTHGLSWGQLGANMGQLQPSWGHLGANLGPT